MRAFYLATRPLVDAFNWLGNLVLKPFGIPPAREVGHAPHSEDELRLLLEQSVREGLIDTYEREFAENVFLFGDLRARQVMVPRGEIDYLRARRERPRGGAARRRQPAHAAAALQRRGRRSTTRSASSTPRSCFASRSRASTPTSPSWLDRITRVSESTLVDEVLRELRRRRQHIALVVDEFGTTVGLVTLEDIIEEIVGEFEEEEEGEHVDTVRREDGWLVVRGEHARWATSRTSSASRSTNGGEATIGGHVVELLGRVPDPGETIDLQGHEVVDRSPSDEARIDELRVRLEPSGGGEE